MNMFNILTKVTESTTEAIETTKEVIESTKEAIEATTTEIASETTTEAVEAALGFTTENIREALLCSAAGMVGIFIVVAIIILSVSILNKAGSEKKKKD
jgi:hypothetical protein